MALWSELTSQELWLNYLTKENRSSVNTYWLEDAI